MRRPATQRAQKEHSSVGVSQEDRTPPFTNQSYRRRPRRQPPATASCLTARRKSNIPHPELPLGRRQRLCHDDGAQPHQPNSAHRPRRPTQYHSRRRRRHKSNRHTLHLDRRRLHRPSNRRQPRRFQERRDQDGGVLRQLILHHRRRSSRQYQPGVSPASNRRYLCRRQLRVTAVDFTTRQACPSRPWPPALAWRRAGSLHVQARLGAAGARPLREDPALGAQGAVVGVRAPAGIRVLPRGSHLGQHGPEPAVHGAGEMAGCDVLAGGHLAGLGEVDTRVFLHGSGARVGPAYCPARAGGCRVPAVSAGDIPVWHVEVEFGTSVVLGGTRAAESRGPGPGCSVCCTVVVLGSLSASCLLPLPAHACPRRSAWLRTQETGGESRAVCSPCQGKFGKGPA